MLVRTACAALGGLLGLIMGGRVQIDARLAIGREFGLGPLGRPLALLTAQLDSVSVTASDARRGPLPFESLTLEGNNVQCGWKLPALLSAPFCVLLLRQPSILFALALLLLVGPPGPKGGLLRFDFLVRDTDLRAGAWPTILSAVLSSITRSSLPALLIGLQTPETRRRLPGSECTGCSVVGKKLVMDGLVRVGGGRPPLLYTLRTGVLPRQFSVGPDGSLLPEPVSALYWQDPELKISLGTSGIAALVPPLWVPVLSASAVQLPPSVSLERIAVSDTVGGLVASGAVSLASPQQRRRAKGVGPPPPADGGGGLAVR